MNIPSHSIPVSSQVHTYSDLRQQIHHDLRVQHPEWILPNGESPLCDSYEARLMEVLRTLAPAKVEALASVQRITAASSFYQ